MSIGKPLMIANMGRDDFGQWLAEQMRRHGNMSQSELARQAEVNQAVVSRLLAGKALPSPDTLRSLARVFKLPPKVVFMAAGELPPDESIDPWAEETAAQLAKLSPRLRRMAESLIDSLIEQQEREEKEEQARTRGRTRPA